MKLERFLVVGFLFCFFPCVPGGAQEYAGEEEGKEKRPSKELLLLELDKRRPDEASPFFADREVSAQFEHGKLRSRLQEEGVAIYPNTASYDSADRVLGKFFRGIKKCLSFKGKQAEEQVEIKVVPGASFSLDDRREITATMIVTNRGKKLTQLVFPTEQRFDFAVKDSAGTVLERWSDDRNFEKEQGILMVNPGETVQFSGTLSTREMQPGQTYTLEGTVAGNSRFTGYFTLKPR